MSPVEYLDLEDLLELVRDLGAGPVRDVGLLDAAAARPRSSAFGADAYSTLSLKAAALMHSLARSHALVDGNKRLALAAVIAMYGLNDRQLTLTNDEAYDLVIAVAARKLDTVNVIAERLGSGVTA